MSDLISRQAAIDAVKGMCGVISPWSDDVALIDKAEVMAKLILLPAVTPQQKTGRWIWQMGNIYKCSECGEDIHVKEVMNVPQYVCCPMCGAKMEEAEVNADGDSN